MKKLQLVKTSLFALGLISGSVMAATQGSLGTDSTGDLEITLDIDDLVQVSNLDDLYLGTFDGTADLSDTDTFCIYRNGAGTFDITMSGDGGSSAFTLTDIPALNTVPYTVDFTNAATTTTMATNVALGGQANANTTSTTCGGTDNVSITVTVATADLASVPAGFYSGTLTMIVSPD